MSRMTSGQLRSMHNLTEPLNSETQKIDKLPFIYASNDKLLIKPGYRLAIIDNEGKVILQDESVKKEVFQAMTEQVIKSFCRKFKSFTEADFKKSQQ